MSIGEVLKAQAATWPDRVAIIDRRGGRIRKLTFAELDAQSRRVAKTLREADFCRGDRLLVLEPISAELYIGLAAIFRLGMAALFPDPAGGLPMIDCCCQLGRPRGLIIRSKHQVLRLLSPQLRRIPQTFSYDRWVLGARRLSPESASRCKETLDYDSRRVLDDPALLTFTSGGTSRPKAALRTQRFLLAQHRAIEQTLELQPGQVDLNTLPVFVLANIASGVTTLLPDVNVNRPDASDAKSLVAWIEQGGATRATAPPAVLQRVAEYCDRAGKTLRGLEKIFTGGGPVSPQLMEQLQRLAPSAAVSAVYGSTEAEPIARLDLADLSSQDAAATRKGRGVLAGTVVPSIELRILPDRWGNPIGPYTAAEFDCDSLSAGKAGEIVVNGPHVLEGYVDGHGDRECKFDVDGTRWHRTGDAGYLDAAGRLWLLGRCVERIRDADGTIYPFSVDLVATQHPRVRRAAVVQCRGTRVLTVECESPAPGSTLDDELRRMLSFANVAVDRVHVLERIPMDKRHNSKVDYPAVHALLEEQA